MATTVQTLSSILKEIYGDSIFDMFGGTRIWVSSKEFKKLPGYKTYMVFGKKNRKVLISEIRYKKDLINNSKIKEIL